MSKLPKGEEIKVRVTAEVKNRLNLLAEERGESESMIVREAINRYLAGRSSVVTSPPRPAYGDHPRQTSVTATIDKLRADHEASKLPANEARGAANQEKSST